MKLYKAQGLYLEVYGNFKPFTVNRQAVLKGVFKLNEVWNELEESIRFPKHNL